MLKVSSNPHIRSKDTTSRIIHADPDIKIARIIDRIPCDCDDPVHQRLSLRDSVIYRHDRISQGTGQDRVCDRKLCGVRAVSDLGLPQDAGGAAETDRRHEDHPPPV